MRIGIDARMYGPKQGGIGRYIEQLILQLEQLDDKNEYVIFLRAENWNEYNPTKSNFKKVLANVHWYGWREQILLPKILKKEKLDLMHFPHWNVPVFYHGKFIVTIHDLLLLHYPTRAASTLGPIAYWFKQIAYKLVLKNAVRKAEKILTVSEFSKQDISKTLNIPAEKIVVTYPAPMTERAKSKEQRANHELSPKIFNLPILFQQNRGSSILRQSKIGIKSSILNSYLLYVGVAYPHKNLEGLLKAWKIFQEKYNSKFQLVLTGRENYFYNKLKYHYNKCNVDETQEILKQVQDDSEVTARTIDPHIVCNDSVVFTGYVTDEQLSELYQNAAAFVMPSFYEGFGIPPLEAMSYGVPIISSNRTCLPEILQDAAGYFDPDDVGEMAEMINKALNNANFREKLKLAGQKLYPQYSWQKLTKQTWEVYQKGV